MVAHDTFTAKVPEIISEHPKFQNWLEDIDGSDYLKIEAAIEKILNEGLITSVKSLNDGLYEKKWNSGLRLYFAILVEEKMKTLLLLGSSKGREQEKAIRIAKLQMQAFNVFSGSINFKK